MRSRKVRIGVIGAGRIGRLHALHLARDVAGAEVATVADVDLGAAQRLADEIGVPRVASEYRTLLDESLIDAVVVSTPVASHSAIVIDAATAGRHVFCEKPLDFDLRRIDAALDAVREAGVKLQLGFNRRFDPGFAAVREVIASGKVGTPELVRITSRDPTPPPISYLASSGGIFLDMAIHDYDMARFLVADEVVSVFATGGVLVDPAIAEVGDLDTAVTVLRFAGGAIATIDNSRRATYGYDQRVEVMGSKRMAALGNDSARGCFVSDDLGMHTAGPTKDTLGRYKDAYRRELAAFVDCIADDSEPLVTGYDGRQATLLALAAAESHRRASPVDVKAFEAAAIRDTKPGEPT